METYSDADDMWLGMLGDVLRGGRENCGGSRDGDVAAELHRGWSGRLLAGEQRTLVTHPERRVDAAYAAAEALWYLSGSDRVDMIERYAPTYRERYADAGGTSGAAYGRRIMDELPWVLRALRRRGETRQAVLTVWGPGDLRVAETPELQKNVPCTLHWQFLARGGLLHMSHVMRSNDAWLGFPYDVFTACCFQRLVAAELGLGVGDYYHRVTGSAHLYGRHLAAAERALAAKLPGAPGHGWRLDDRLETAATAVQLEADLRLENRPGVEIDLLGSLGSMGFDLFAACSYKTVPEDHWVPYSKRIRDLCSR